MKCTVIQVLVAKPQPHFTTTLASKKRHLAKASLLSTIPLLRPSGLGKLFKGRRGQIFPRPSIIHCRAIFWQNSYFKSITTSQSNFTYFLSIESKDLRKPAILNQNFCNIQLRENILQSLQFSLCVRNTNFMMYLCTFQFLRFANLRVSKFMVWPRWKPRTSHATSKPIRQRCPSGQFQPKKVK